MRLTNDILSAHTHKVWSTVILLTLGFTLRANTPVRSIEPSPNFAGPLLPFTFGSTFTTWLRADDASSVTTSTNGSTVTTWADVATTGTARDFTTAAGTAPNYIDDETGVGVQNLNFNPVIDFNTVNASRLTIANNNEFNLTPTAGGANFYTNKSFTMAFRTDSDITTRQVLYEQGGGTRGINLYIFNNTLYSTAWNRSAGDGNGDDWNTGGTLSTVSIGISANTPYLVTFELRGDPAPGTNPAAYTGRN